MTQKFLEIGTPSRKIFFLVMVLSVALPSLMAAETNREQGQIWETQIKPVSERFTNLESVYLILTFRNVSKETRQAGLPYREDQPWFQWIEIK